MSYELLHGDCAVMLKQIPDTSVELTVTSPPYDNIRDYNGFSFDFETIAKELYRVTKDGGIVVWVVGDQTADFGESLTSFKQAIFFVEQCGFNLLDTMIYQKNSGPTGSDKTRRYYDRFEYMFVFCKGIPVTWNLIRDKENKGAGTIMRGTRREKDGSVSKQKKFKVARFRVRDNIWAYDVSYGTATKDEIAREHPAKFPELLAQDHILTWSNKGDTVLDPFLGSGTTGKIAILQDRKFIGIEISDEYLEMATRRLDDVSGNRLKFD